MTLDNAIVIMLITLTISGLLWIQFRSKRANKECAVENRRDYGSEDKWHAGGNASLEIWNRV